MTSLASPFRFGRFDDIAAQAQQLEGYDQLYVQLERGKFSGEFTNFGFGNGLEFATERVNRIIHQRAAVPRGTLTLGYLAHSEGDYRVNGLAMGAGDIFLFPAGADIEVTSSHSAIVVVSLPELALPDTIGGSRHYRPRIFNAIDPEVRSLGAMIRHANRQVLDNPSLLVDRSLGADVLAGLVSALQRVIDGKALPEGGASLFNARLATFRKIFERFNASPGDFSMNAVCAQLGISRRTAELSFQEIVGISPSRYVQLCRLNMLRSALREMPPRSGGIGETAALLGINHLGRLAGEYARMFGLKPSQEAIRSTNTPSASRRFTSSR